MKTRLAAAFVAVLAVCAGALAAVPAEAASKAARPIATYLTVDSKGYGAVPIRCASSKTCRGWVGFADGKTIRAPYEIKPWGTSYVRYRMDPSSGWFPYNNPGADQVGEIARVRGVTLRLAEYKPSQVTNDYKVVIDSRLPGSVQQLRGTLFGLAGTAVRDLEVELNLVSGGRVIPTATRDGLSPGDSYSFNIPMDTFNRPKAKFVLRIIGTTPSGERRSWWWRGTNDNFYGGAGNVRQSVQIAPSLTDFVADFRWGVLTGQITNPNSYYQGGANITVAAPPWGLGKPNNSAKQDLEIERCANSFGSTKTAADGSFKVDFLPTTVSSSGNVYGVRAVKGAAETWSGVDPSLRWVSCNALLRYDAYDKSNMIKVDNSSGVGTAQVPLYATGSTDAPYKIKVNRVSKTSRTINDYWVTIRDKVPGVPVLEAPIIYQGASSVFAVQPGTYWVETARRQGCSSWIPTIYPDNDGIFKDEARDAERWKVVKGSKGSATAHRYGFVDQKPPRGYAGWMYREHCKTLTSGNVTSFSVGNGNPNRKEVGIYQSRGAVVSGVVKRQGGKTNKEIMVRLSSSQGTLVYRTDLTDSKGRFYVAGLAPGNYSISVNSDSWRGNKQAFKGRKTIRVSGSKTYSAGTLTFQE